MCPPKKYIHLLTCNLASKVDRYYLIFVLLTLIDNMQQKRGGYLKVTNIQNDHHQQANIVNKSVLHTLDERESFPDINIFFSGVGLTPPGTAATSGLLYSPNGR
jgi:hypothetical protein